MVRRCKRCVLPETYAGISFDAHGECNFCLAHRSFFYQGKDALLRILSMYRNKGKKYDCIVPVSGGKDSTFVLHQIHKVYGLKVLAFNYESGFSSSQAKKNLRKMIRVLNVDFVCMKSNRDTQKRCLVNNIKAWTHNPSAEPLPSLCYGCKNGYLGGAYRVAREMGIPLIVMGDAMVENMQIERRKSALAPHRSATVNLMFKILKNPFYLAPWNLRDYLLMQIEFWLPKSMQATRANDKNTPVKILHFFDFIKYDKEMLSTIVNELGWKKKEDLISPWRFDCEIHAILEYMLKRKFGFTERDEYYSEAIRNGDMSRDEALESLMLEEPRHKALYPIMNRVFEKLGLSEKETQLILNC